MRKEDLKVGQVVEISDNGEKDLCLITTNNEGLICISGELNWFPVDSLNECLEHKLDRRCMITKVYSRTSAVHAHKLSTNRRKLIWERDGYRKDLPNGIKYMKKLHALLNLEEFDECGEVHCHDCPLNDDICTQISKLTDKINALNKIYKLDGDK